MARGSNESTHPGVYALDPLRPVHRYQGGDYELEDVVELFQLGRVESDPEGGTVVVMTGAELHQLEIIAHAHSFDYEEPFIEMCLEMARFAATAAGESFRFVANF